MRIVKKYVLSSIPIPNATPLDGMRAQEVAKEMGLRYVHVSDDGVLTALDKDQAYLSGQKIYEKKAFA